MENLYVKKLSKTANLPDKAYELDAGFDLYSDEKEEVILSPGQRKTFSTGVSVQMPDWYVGFVCPRSGHAVKKGIDVLAGVIDSSYRGEIGVVLINHSDTPQIFKHGDKIAQFVIQQLPQFKVVEVKELDSSDRGENGFGSSGS